MTNKEILRRNAVNFPQYNHGKHRKATEFHFKCWAPSTWSLGMSKRKNWAVINIRYHLLQKRSKFSSTDILPFKTFSKVPDFFLSFLSKSGHVNIKIKMLLNCITGWKLGCTHLLLLCSRCCPIDFYTPQFSSSPFQIQVTCLLHQNLVASQFWVLCDSICGH